MKRIHKYMDIRWLKHKEDWDTVIVIDGNGDVGIGKSNLALNMMDYWLTKRHGSVLAEHIKQLGIDKNGFLKALAKSDVLDIAVYDEAGELTSRRAMTNFNVKLMIAYKVIRADRIFTILVIDDIFDLDPYFRKKRVKALFSVDRRGHVNIWLKNKLRLMLSMNQNFYIKNRFVVSPNFQDTFPKYAGVLKEPYDKLKQEKTTEARKELLDESDGIIKRETIEDLPLPLVNEIRCKILDKAGITKKVISNLVDISPQHAGVLIKKGI